MEDTSLMNPEHLKSELLYLETEAIPAGKKLAKELKKDFRRILGYVSETHNRGESTTLTRDQVTDLIQTLAKYDNNTWKYYRKHEFDARVYRQLMKDRRWFIGSRLRFLKK